MFSVHCPTHGTEVLLSERRIDSIRSYDGGHEVSWRCWCGTTGSTSVPHVSSRQMVGRHRPAV